MVITRTTSGLLVLGIAPVGNLDAQGGLDFLSVNHTNEVTRLWATGPRSECLPAFVVGVDPGLRDIIGHNEDGRYIDTTAIAPVIRAAIEGRPCPVPGM